MHSQIFHTVLIAVNAQYIHTGLGIRSIAAYVRQETNSPIDTMEFTINNPEQDILAALYDRNADAYLFSCYIWNIELILRLARNLRQLLPHTLIGLGGPQVSYQAETVLKNETAVDLVVTGEGEATVCQLIELLNAKASLHNCQGIVRREEGQILVSPPREPLSMRRFDLAGWSETLDNLVNFPVYLTLDLDVLDPGGFCGTGTPEAGGLNFRELMGAIVGLHRANIVGADLVELSPHYDASGASTAAACKLTREILLQMKGM